MLLEIVQYEWWLKQTWKKRFFLYVLLKVLYFTDPKKVDSQHLRRWKKAVVISCLFAVLAMSISVISILRVRCALLTSHQKRCDRGDKNIWLPKHIITLVECTCRKSFFSSRTLFFSHVTTTQCCARKRVKKQLFYAPDCCTVHNDIIIILRKVYTLCTTTFNLKYVTR